MPYVTIADVSLYSRDRGRSGGSFEMALTDGGIEISRQGGDKRHLPWDRITEWEIEQRRGGVLLTLRGSGAVTPLIIPEWRVEDLDKVLREVTSQIRVPETVAEPVREAEPGTEVRHEPPPAAEEATAYVPPAFSEVYREPFDALVDFPETQPVETAEDVEVDLWGDQTSEEGLDAVLWPTDAPTGPGNGGEEPSWSLGETAFEGAADAPGGTGPEDEEGDVEGTLEWPSDAPVESIPDLEWPTGSAKGRRAAAPPEEAAAVTESPTEDHTPMTASAPAPASTPWVIEEVENLPPAPPTATLPVVTQATKIAPARTFEMPPSRYVTRPATVSAAAPTPVTPTASAPPTAAVAPATVSSNPVQPRTERRTRPARLSSRACGCPCIC